MPGWTWIANVGSDVRFALRGLRNSPSFSVVAITVLALGIGANTAIFSIVYAVLLRPLPFREPGRVMMVFEKIPERGVDRANLCAANFVDLQQQNRSFSDTAIFSGRGFALTGDASPEQVAGALVSSSFFSVLGVAPEHGRSFRTEDELPGASAAVVLSQRLWQRRFGGDIGIVGRTILVDGRAHEVVGIMPPGFYGLFRNHELWAPMQLTAAERADRASHYLLAVGRLKPDVSLQQARADLDVIGNSLAREYPGANSGRGLSAAPVRDELVGDTKAVLVMLMGAVSLVLLVASVNVANLLLARALTRRREMALRRALGAGTARLVQQLLTEGLLLAVLGLGAGLLVARGVIRLLPLLIPRAESLAGLDEVAIDAPVLAVAMAIGLVVTAFFGCLPAWQVLRASSDALNERATTGTSRGHRVRSALLASEVACSLVLVLGAVLLLRSFANLMVVNPGFRAAPLLAVPLQLPSESSERSVFLEQVREQVRGIPGVESVAAIEYLPLSGSGVTRRMLVEGRARPEPGKEPIVHRHLVTPGYFQTMSIPLHAGRAFLDPDMSTKHLLVMVNETMARRYWPGQSPVGSYIRLGTQATVANAPLREVVGVVGDVRHSGLRSEPSVQVYVPLGQDTWPATHLVVRAAGMDPARLIPAVKSAVWAVDKTQTLPNIKPMSTIVAESVWQPRLNTVVLSAFAAVTLALVLAGIYGLMMRIVGDRTAEIGIRMAMGATAGSILGLVLRQGLLPVILGAVAGLGLAVAAGRFVSAQLYGVTQADPLTFAAGTVAVVAAALLAMVRPALRATSVDPVIALRYE